MDTEILKFVEDCEKNLTSIFKHYDKMCLINQEKVLNAFRNNNVGLHHFNGTTGYGYDDIGREMIGKVYAEVFGGEAGVASPLISCGSQAVSMALFGLLKSGDTMLSITGKPYDTLDATIFGENNGGFKDYNISYHQIDMIGSKINIEKVCEYVEKNLPKVIFIQRSRGYEFRKSLSVYYIGEVVQKLKQISPNSFIVVIGEVVQKLKQISPNSFIVVDNCYGEFLEEVEPCTVGADVCVGSLTKNPGGGIAPCGGYVVGTKRAVELITARFTSPSLHTEVGSYENGYIDFSRFIFRTSCYQPSN